MFAVNGPRPLVGADEALSFNGINRLPPGAGVCPSTVQSAQYLESVWCCTPFRPQKRAVSTSNKDSELNEGSIGNEISSELQGLPSMESQTCVWLGGKT